MFWYFSYVIESVSFEFNWRIGDFQADVVAAAC